MPQSTLIFLVVLGLLLLAAGLFVCWALLSKRISKNESDQRSVEVGLIRDTKELAMIDDGKTPLSIRCAAEAIAAEIEMRLIATKDISDLEPLLKKQSPAVIAELLILFVERGNRTEDIVLLGNLVEKQSAKTRPS